MNNKYFEDYPIPDDNYSGPSDDELKRIEEEIEKYID